MKICAVCREPGKRYRTDLQGGAERKTCRECEAKRKRVRRGTLDARTFDTTLPFDEDRTIDQPVNDQAPWPHGSDMSGAAPDGFTVRGVSTLYDAAGEVKAQWVKSSRQEEDRLRAFEEAIAALAEPLRGIADPVAPPPIVPDDLLCSAVLGDPHVGLHAWSKETGDRDFDLAEAESNIVTAIDQLVDLGPRANRFVLTSLGDTFHADNYDSRTARSGHALDVDTRWPKVMSVGIRILRRCIDRALTKYGEVEVKIVPGNHDPHSAIMLALCLANFYEREPRVKVDTSPSKFLWVRFGKVLIMFTHGDMTKMAELPGIMAASRPQDWGETTFRYAIQGHVHHDQVKEYAGAIVESRRTLAPIDAWHAASGYRSGQDVKMDVYHREWGRINQHIVGIQRVIAASRGAA